MLEEDDVVRLDSCASKGLFIVRDQSYSESTEYTPGGAIQQRRREPAFSV